VLFRSVLVALSSGGYALPTDAGSNQFRVTLPTPEMYSIQPLRSTVGQSVTMTINGNFFGSASSVNFTPSSGITVNNPPTVSPDGTTVTTTFTIAANAALGSRVVTVTTPGGTTGNIAGPTNSFTVTEAADPGVTHTAFSAGLGVLVETPAVSPDKNVTYGPTASQPLGVTVGATIQRITPISGAIGSSLTVRAEGIGLESSSAISFQPPDGITVNSFAIVAGNPEVNITIAPNAAVTPRTVLVALSTGGYALPTDAGSNQFRITLPTPDIQSVQPIRAMVGQVVAMTIMGTNFGLASSVDFIPATGITVANPPTVSLDGTMITVNITLAADAPLGTRVVTATTPGGTTSAAATPANSFTVTADQGTTYTPLLSPELGVMVMQSSGDGQVVIPYGPLSSAEVGVMVTPLPAPGSQDVAYGPLVSTQLGVAVGGHFTGFSPFALEPGSSAIFTLYGTGLDQVTAISIVPVANLSVTDWTPAGDGRSGTFTITADAGVVQGTRTIVPLVESTALPCAAAGDRKSTRLNSSHRL